MAAAVDDVDDVDGVNGSTRRMREASELESFDPRALPDELWALVFAWLDVRDLLCAVAPTCRLFLRLAKDEHLWQQRFRTRFPNAVLRSELRPLSRERLLKAGLAASPSALPLVALTVDATAATAVTASSSVLHEPPRPTTGWLDEFRWRCDGRNHVAFFNAQPFLCIKSLMLSGFLNDELEIAQFLRRPGISPYHVGNLISMFSVPDRCDPKKLCYEYLRLLNFNNMGFIDAMRKFAREVRLPNEAGYVSRIMEALAKCYFEATGGDQDMFVSEERVFLLLYAVLMLNVDAHNPRVKRKMSCKKFIRSNQCPLLPDLTQDFLKGVYNSIQAQQLTTADFHCSSNSIIVRTGWLDVCKTDWRQQGRVRGAKRRWIVLTTEKMFCCKSAEATEVPERELLLSPSNTTLIYGAMSSASPASSPCSLSSLFASDAEQPASDDSASLSSSNSSSSSLLSSSLSCSMPSPSSPRPLPLPTTTTTSSLDENIVSPVAIATVELATYGGDTSVTMDGRSASPPPRASSPTMTSSSSSASSLFRVRRGRSSPPRELSSSSPPGSSSLSALTRQKKPSVCAHFVLSFKRTKFSRRAVALQEQSFMSLHFSAASEPECLEWVKAIADVIEAQTSADWRVFCREHGLMPRGMDTE